MKWLPLPLFLLCLASLVYGSLNKTYPTSATTEIRMEMVTDNIGTIWKSTTTEFMRYEVDGSTTEFSLSTRTVEAIKLSLLNEMIDKDIEQYLVFPGTSTTNWKGWCLRMINNNPVPVPCQ
jgi:hypothetical protein